MPVTIASYSPTQGASISPPVARIGGVVRVIQVGYRVYKTASPYIRDYGVAYAVGRALRSDRPLVDRLLSGVDALTGLYGGPPVAPYAVYATNWTAKIYYQVMKRNDPNANGSNTNNAGVQGNGGGHVGPSGEELVAPYIDPPPNGMLCGRDLTRL